MAIPSGLLQVIARTNPQLRANLRKVAQGPSAPERERSAKSMATKACQHLKERLFVPDDWIAEIQSMISEAAAEGIALTYTGHRLPDSGRRIHVTFDLELLESVPPNTKTKVLSQKLSKLRKLSSSGKYWRVIDGSTVTFMSLRKRSVFGKRSASRHMLTLLGGYRFPHSRAFGHNLGRLEEIGQAAKSNTVTSTLSSGQKRAVDKVADHILASAAHMKKDTSQVYLDAMKDRKELYRTLTLVRPPTVIETYSIDAQKQLKDPIFTQWLVDEFFSVLWGALLTIQKELGLPDKAQIRFLGQRFYLGDLVKGLDKLAKRALKVETIIRMIEALLSGNLTRVIEVILEALLIVGVTIILTPVSPLGSVLASIVVADLIEKNGGLFASIELVFETTTKSIRELVETSAYST